MEPNIDERRNALLTEFSSAWQTEISKVSEMLSTGWRVPLERLVTQAEQYSASDLAALRADHKRFSGKMAQNLRRMRTFEGESQWSNIVADAAQLASSRAIVFSINADKLRFQAARGFALSDLPEIPLAEAAAFQAAATASEPAIALKSRREISEALAARIGEDLGQRIAVYPITTRERVAALVYAEDADSSWLDVVVTAAGASLDGHLGRGQAPPSNIVTITPAAGTPFVTRDEEERHSRAQRFARVQVAEIRLYHSSAVKAGRADNNVYRALQPQIDGVRQQYQEQYLKNAPNMTDYLHQEILRTLANGNLELLGPDYPGPLV